jgi:hypothetical protein
VHNEDGTPPVQGSVAKEIWANFRVAGKWSVYTVGGWIVEKLPIEKAYRYVAVLKETFIF